MSQNLPEGVSAASFDAALNSLRAVVGTRYVFVDPLPVSSYRDAYSPLPDAATMPSAAVAPDGIEQIQKVLQVANEHRLPLWVTGNGRNFAYGGPAPRKPGYVVLDLKRMNRILEINEKYGYALVEPGVSYMQLYQHLQKMGSKLWIDCAAPAWGGVLGNAVDHGVGYTPYGDHLMMQCGMEVVLADGTVVRTGQGSLPGSQNWQIGKHAVGPFLDGLFTQSNFGVVTKMGIWLMPEPPGYKPFMITFPREDDLERVMDVARPLKVNQVIPNGVVAVDLLWEASAKTSRRQYYDGDGPLPPSVRAKIAQDYDLGMWNFYGALYGPPPMIENSWKIVEAAFRSIPGAKVFLDRGNDPAWVYRAKLMRGIPNMTEFSLMNWVGGGGHINFSPISPPDGKKALEQYRLMEKRCHEYGFDYIGEFVIGWRDMHHILMLMFDRANEPMRKRAIELFGVMIDDAAEAGFGEYRTHLMFMDQIARTYKFNDHALWDLHHRIKDTLDPNGILSPGKMGIWPKSMRQQAAAEGSAGAAGAQ
jgi:4-cresol dehydrogenase (hydroxylating)